FPPPPATEALSEAERAAPVANGTFIHANPSDPLHWGRGKVSVYRRAVFLEPDFEVGPGPAFHVYLVPKATVRGEADVKDALFASLVGGVAGYGTGVLLPLVLVPITGAETVVPIIAITALFTNTSRAVAFRDRISWLRTAIVLAGALPTCVLGAYGFTLLTG